MRSNGQSIWRKRGESSTFRRLLNSQHVSDLRLIFFVALGSVLVVGGLAVFFKLHQKTDVYSWRDTGTFIGAIAATGAAVVAWAYKAGSKQIRLIFFLTLWSAVLLANFFLLIKLIRIDADPSAYSWGETAKFIGAIAAAGATIMAWAYQAGSKRLGVVDLFACEIVTLCRVGTVVEFIPNMLTQYNSIGSAPEKPATSEHPPQALRFNSDENYFPVFESNSKDLQILEADVVNNVTAFYTYMKATRDTLRQLGDLRLAAGPADAERKAVINVIFMVFLAYESARRVIDDLIEFEPTHAENEIVLLFTELPAFHFLRGIYAVGGRFPDAIRAQRLQLRLKEYQCFIPDLCKAVRGHAKEEEWQKASSMIDGLAGVFAVIKAEGPASSAAADEPPPAANAA